MNLVELPNESESSRLASRARDGDLEALNTLLLRHAEWLHRVARIELGAQLRRQVDSMDVVQEVGVIAIQRIGDLRITDAASVRSWLRSILSYRLKELAARLTAEKRDMRREVPLAPPKPWDSTRSGAFDPSGNETSPGERAERLEMRELLDEVVGELPENQRIVVLMRDYDHAEWERIRDEMAASTIAAVQQMHHRAWAAILDKASKRV